MDGHVGVEFPADINIGGKAAFDNKAFGLYILSQVGCDTSPEAPAEKNDVPGRDVFLFGEPFVCRFDIAVCSGLGGLTLTGAVAAVIEDEAVKAEFIQYIYSVEPVGHITTVSVAEQDRKIGFFGGDEPCREFQTVFRLENDIFKRQVDIAGIVGHLANGAVEKRRLHKVQCQPKDRVSDKNDQYD